jgi:predicted GNAT superfamily acetyltransferase
MQDSPAPIASDLAASVLALNNVHAVELSWLDPPRLSHLIAQAFYARCNGKVDAFLLAFDQDADYDSANFMWFRERYTRFVYVDRVAVQETARGRGLAKRLYTDLFARATAASHQVIGCEVNRDPPNPASDAFHAAFGFIEIGSAAIHGGSKTVRYLERRIV